MYAATEDGGAGIRTEILDENFGVEAILPRSRGSTRPLTTPAAAVMIVSPSWTLSCR